MIDKISENVLEFSGVKEFLSSNYKPLTQYGIEQAANIKLITDMKDLHKGYDLISNTVIFIKKEPSKADQIEYFLNHIPLLNNLDVTAYDSTDLFLIKKFLINYKKILNALNSNMINGIDVSFDSNELLDTLCLDGEDSETFYLSDAYCDELASVRKDIRGLIKEFNKIRKEQIENILKKTKLDFRFKDFLVIEESKAVGLSASGSCTDMFFIEPYDSKYVVIKPIFKSEYHRLHHKKDKLIAKERELEAIALKKISKDVNKEKEKIKKYVSKITILDTLFAKARLAISFDMTVPVIKDKRTTNAGKIMIHNGRFIPTQLECKKLSTDYYPLTADFASRINVITGSNMGGKTVLLKTISFLQILAQFGFLVPAKKFESVIFDEIFYIGDESLPEVNGLSSFGFEIYNFNRMYNTSKGKRCLFLIDEFARNTNSKEAVALSSAIIKDFLEKENIFAFYSTHFMELPRMNGIDFFRMKGLNYIEYKKSFNEQKKYELNDRIRMINLFMRYEIEPDDSNREYFDAINIANILGLDIKIIEDAKKQLR